MALANITNNILTDSGILVSSLQGALTLTTTGSSGASTLIGNTLNIPNYGGGLTGYVPYTGATGSVNLGTNDLTSRYLVANGSAGLGGVLNIKQDATYLPLGNGFSSIASSFNSFDFFGYTGASTYKNFQLRFDGLTNNTVRTYTLPDASGTIALTSALSGMVTGTGTTNYLPKFTGTSTIGNSLVFDNGTNVGIGTASPVSKLQVAGGGLFTGGDYTDASLVNAMKIGYNTTNNYGYLESVQVDATERPLRVNQYGGTTSFGGKVSIGSNTPTAFGTQRFLVVGSAASQIARYTDGTNGDLVFDFPSATISRITAQYGTGGVLVFANGTGFNEQMRLNASGNLSIGNTNDTYKLDVTGTARFTGQVTSETQFYAVATPPATNGGLINVRDTVTATNVTSFAGVFFNSSPGNDYSIGKLTENNAGFLQIRNANSGAELLRINASGVATFSSSVSVAGLNLTSTYASKIGLYNSSSAANMELGTNTSTNGAIVSRLTSYNVNNGNSGNESSSNFMGIVSLETQLQGTNGGNFILKTKGDGGTLDTRFTIASTGAATFSSSIKTGAPSGGTAQPWKLGTVYTGTCVPNSFGDFTSWFTGTVIEIEVNGTTYKIPAVIDNYC